MIETLKYLVKFDWFYLRNTNCPAEGANTQQ